MKTALVQSHIHWEDRDRNVAEFEKIVSENPDTDLFLLPEMSFTGFSMNTAKTGERSRETVMMIREIAIRYKKSIGFGWVRQSGEKCENVYTILDQNGQEIPLFFLTVRYEFWDDGTVFANSFFVCE